MRCMTGEKPKEWVQWVSLAEYWYNTNYHSSAHTTPFEIVYGQPPNLHVPYIGGTSAIEEVDRTMQAREQAIAMLQFHLKRSQDRIKSMADKKRSDRSFEVGMKVYLKLQPYRQITARQGIHHKFAAKFYGHFLIIAKVGKVAYKLDSAHTTPFEIVYGQPPNLHLPYIAGTSVIEEVDRTMQAREQAIAMLQFHLKRSQDRIKSMADKKRSDISFEFAAKFYGPFLIIAKVGKVAYKLDLPADIQIHPVFHVSQLKLCKGTNHQVGVLPHCGPDGVLSMEPEVIIGRRLGKLNNKVVLYILVKWINQTEEDATWELYTDLIKRFPQMELHP
ncbi:retrotransposable element Tf2 [Tanacetum coccineum]